MGLIFIFLGVLISVAIYLYFINKLHESEDRSKKEEVDVEAEEKEPIKTKEEKPEGLKPRFCPLCNSSLVKHDSIYAEMYKGEQRPKVVIHGCRYCYKPSGKKTNFDMDDINVGKNE